MSKQSNGSVKKVLSVIGNVILWIFVAFAVLMTVLVFSAQGAQDGLPSIGGKAVLTIVSDSMKPTFQKGDLLFVQRLTEQQKTDCKVGDVVTFLVDLDKNGTEEINTHRVVSIREDNGLVYYKTKGDNNSTDDNYEVVSSKLLARYTGTRMVGMGNAISFLQSSTGFLCVIVIPLVLFFLFELYRFIAVIISMKNKGKLSAEDEEAIKKAAVEEYLKAQQETDTAEVTAPSADEIKK